MSFFFQGVDVDSFTFEGQEVTEFYFEGELVWISVVAPEFSTSEVRVRWDSSDANPDFTFNVNGSGVYDGHNGQTENFRWLPTGVSVDSLSDYEVGFNYSSAEPATWVPLASVVRAAFGPSSSSTVWIRVAGDSSVSDSMRYHFWEP
ncbi:hypothetical protein [Vibrio sp.]|uniref:hypothetical protein n=1 Tax=Vibrio sp. TaxID=678 RepID=UPI0037B3BA60